MTEEIYDAASDTRSTVPCTEPHGSETFLVTELPDEAAALPRDEVAELPDDSRRNAESSTSATRSMTDMSA